MEKVVGGHMFLQRKVFSLPHNRVIHPPADVVHQELGVGFGHSEVQDGDHVFYRGWGELASGVEIIDDPGYRPLVTVG